MGFRIFWPPRGNRRGNFLRNLPVFPALNGHLMQKSCREEDVTGKSMRLHDHQGANGVQLLHFFAPRTSKLRQQNAKHPLPGLDQHGSPFVAWAPTLDASCPESDFSFKETPAFTIDAAPGGAPEDGVMRLLFQHLPKGTLPKAAHGSASEGRCLMLHVALAWTSQRGCCDSPQPLLPPAPAHPLLLEADALA